MIKNRDGAAIDSLMLTFVRVVTAFISIIIYKLLAVSFSLEDYGLYSQVMLIVTTATSLSILGLTDAVNYFYNREKDSPNGDKYIQTIFALQFIIGTFFAIIIVIFKNQIALYFGNKEISAVIPYIALLPLLVNILNMLQVLFVSNKKAKIIAIRNFMLSFIKVVLIAIISFSFKEIKYILMSTLLIDLITIIYMLIYSAKNIIKINPIKADFKLTMNIFFYSIPMATYIITNSLSRNMDKLVIGWLADTKSLGLYTIAAKELPFDMLTSAFMTVLIPYITRNIVTKRYKNAAQTFSKYIQISYVIIWTLGIGAIFFSKDLMLLLYDVKYLPALNIFRIYMIVDMIKFANTSLIFSIAAKTKELLIYSWTTLGINLIFSIFSYNLLGLIGPAVVTAIITFVLSVVMLVRSAAILKADFFELLQIRQAVLIIIEGLLFGFIAYKITDGLFVEVNIVIKFILRYSLYLVPMILFNFSRTLGLLKSINQEKLL